PPEPSAFTRGFTFASITRFTATRTFINLPLLPRRTRLALRRFYPIVDFRHNSKENGHSMVLEERLAAGRRTVVRPDAYVNTRGTPGLFELHGVRRGDMAVEQRHAAPAQKHDQHAAGQDASYMRRPGNLVPRIGEEHQRSEEH